MQQNIKDVIKSEQILEKIYDASLSFLIPVTLDETYKVIVEEAMKLVNGEFGSIFLGEKGDLVRVYATTDEFYKVVPRKQGFTYKVFSDRKPTVLSSVDMDKAHPEFKIIGTRSDIMIPLSLNDKSMGVLTIMSKKDKNFTTEDLNILKFFGPLASLAIQKAKHSDEITKALETRDLFISMASHELKTPLTAINGYTQLLRTKIPNTENTEGRWIEQLSWECLRMTILIKELLAVNQIRSGKIPYEWQECSLIDLLSRVQNDCTFVYPHRDISFKIEVQKKEDIVIGDYDKLLQVLTNVIENAVKFSDPASKVVVTLRHKNPYIIFSVKDSGIGIDIQDLPQVFDKYFTSKSHTREGMGIGLFIVKDIIDQHKGVIKITTKLKRGTKVEIKLPKARI